MDEHLTSNAPSPAGPGPDDADPRALADVERRIAADALYREARSIRQTDRARLKELAEQSLELSCQVDAGARSYEAGTANALSMLAYFNAVDGNSEASLSQAAQALALLDTSIPSLVLGDIYDSMGWALFEQGDFVESLEALLEALRVARAIGDRGLEAYAYDTMASVYSTTGRWNDSLEGHLKALALHQELDDHLGAALTMNNMVYTYLGLEDTTAALESALGALAYIAENNLPHIEISALDTVAAVYLAKGELDTAHDYAMRGLKLARANAKLREQCDNLMTLGQISLKQGHYDDALAELEQALTMAVHDKRAVEEYTCHELLARIHERRGDMAAALAEYHVFHTLERARFNEESATRLAHLRIEHQLDSARKDAEIHRLRSLALEREVEERRIAQARLEAQASLDPLTGLYNRRHLEVLAEELRLATSRGDSVCLMLFDIDHFKEINDSHGHLAGDRVLVAIAALLQSNSRGTDIPCRYGGDEFLVLLVDMDSSAGVEAAERLRAAVAATTIESDAARLDVTISAGVACTSTSMELGTLIAQADRALYTAKQAGRNRVVAD